MSSTKPNSKKRDVMSGMRPRSAALEQATSRPLPSADVLDQIDNLSSPPATSSPPSGVPSSPLATLSSPAVGLPSADVAPSAQPAALSKRENGSPLKRADGAAASTGRLNVLIDKAILKRFKVACAAHDMSASHAVEQAIASYLDAVEAADG